jgi:hypothetical protein
MAEFANRANNINTKPAIGMAGRRQRPAFSLRDIDPSILPDPHHIGGGPLGAGLGAGRPSLLRHEQPRRPPQAGNFGSPFSNFSKIVYVFFFFFFSILQSLTIIKAIHLVLSISMEKQFYMLMASTFQTVPPSLSTWISYSSMKS